MTPDLPPHQDRARARSFGQAAIDYDRFRPRYPQHVVDTVAFLAGTGFVIDVGAGTGIFTRQLRDHRLDVIAVEPDAEMAAVARDHGLRVEEATFEEWNVGDRRPRVVVFANSWHWVDHTTALPNIRDMLAPGGHLVLIWHALKPAGAIAERIDDVYHQQQLPDAQPAPTPPNTDYLTVAGSTVTTDTHLTEATWPTQAWLNQQFTISTHLVLTPQRAHRLRRALTNAIAGVVPLTEHTYIVTASV